MSTQIKTADPAPIPVTDGQDGSVTVGNTPLSAAQVAALKEHWVAANQILVAPPLPLLTVFLYCKALLQACIAGDRKSVVASLGNLLTFLCTFLGLKNLPKINKKGAPTQPGCVAAIRASVVTLNQFATETANAGVKPADLSSQGDDLDVWWDLQTLLLAAIEKIRRNAIPESKTAVGLMRQILTVVDPLLDTHSDLALAIKAALTYLKDPYIKAKKTRKTNQRKAKQITAQVQGEMLPQARAQARQEVTTQLSDVLSGIFGGGAMGIGGTAGNLGGGSAGTVTAGTTTAVSASRKASRR